MKTNVNPRTHENAPAKRINPAQELRRTVMACLLWEDSFYESGKSVAERIAKLVPQVEPQEVCDLAEEARVRMKLRHVPLWLACEMLEHKAHRARVAGLLLTIIQRPDEMTELLSLYWREGRRPLAAQLKKGLRDVFLSFDEYQLAKWDRPDAPIRLRDVAFLVHPRPTTPEQAELLARLTNKSYRQQKAHWQIAPQTEHAKIATPDTWEVAISATNDKLRAWRRLLVEKRLPPMAFLRNLRNLQQVGVEDGLIRDAFSTLKTDRILPFRFIAAAQHAPRFEPELEEALFRCLAGKTKLGGHTILLVDVSGSMNGPLSSKGTLSRMDAAYGLAMLARELCETVQTMTFSDRLVEVPPRRGFALRDAVVASQAHRGTRLGSAIAQINDSYQYDRLIVITDEQSHDRVGAPRGLGYMINVGTYSCGVGYGSWTHIDGWSESVMDYIQEVEKDEHV